MAEATFTWKKVASFVGALVLVVIAYLTISLGIQTIVDGGEKLYGVASIIGGTVCVIDAILIYLNYQKKVH